LGVKELSRPANKARSESQRRAARAHFDAAATQFGLAAKAFTSGAKEPPPDARELSPVLEWSIRSRCDQAEMHLRNAQPDDARALLSSLLREPVLVKSRYRGLALYYHGVANYLLHDYLVAGRSLNTLTPFHDSAFGT